jgi:DNA-binding NtrC family response regulator
MVAGSARTLAEIQREAIEQALTQAGGRISGPRGAAVALGLKPSTLVSRMERLGMRPAGGGDRAPRRRSVDTVSTRMDTGRNA